MATGAFWMFPCGPMGHRPLSEEFWATGLGVGQLKYGKAAEEVGLNCVCAVFESYGAAGNEFKALVEGALRLRLYAGI
jgi:hypothetical protein